MSRFSSSSSASCPSIAYLFWHRVRLSLSILALCSSIAYLFRNCVWISLSFSALCPNFPHFPRHRVRASLIFFGIASAFFLIFLDIVSRLSFSASRPAFIIFSCIVCEHHLSFPASSPVFIIFFGTVSGFSSSSSASCPSIAFNFLLSFLASCLNYSFSQESCLGFS